MYEVLTFPDDKLRHTPKLVENFNSEELEALTNKMLETMYSHDGIGLAATQIGLDANITVIDVNMDIEDKSKSNPIVFINPTIKQKSGTIDWEEGCLSIPGLYAKVKRSKEVVVQYYDIYGKDHEIKADGLLSVCIQHEIDHLNGILFYDRLSPLKQRLVQGHMKKLIEKKK